MDYEEFKRRLGKAGVSLKEFAALVGVTSNAVSNYAGKGSVPLHFAVEATLMGEMAEKKVDFRGPLVALEKSKRRPRGAAARGVFGGSKQRPIFNDD
jgi:transcriptional regulator with XRE-family HTH domain